MLETLAVANYRSIRELTLPLGALNVIHGPNGSGKSNLYRALRLLCDVANDGVVSALAREGGLQSALWAGPESFSAAMRRGEQAVQGGQRRRPVALRLGIATDAFSYAIDLGLPIPGASHFDLDPQIKREAIWHGGTYHPQRALTERDGASVRGRDDEGRWRLLDSRLAPWDSMLSRLADPRVAPEAALLRDELRAWRFYDHFRCDADAPARRAQIGVRTPVLAHDGADLAAAWQTIVEIGDPGALSRALGDAFPGAVVDLHVSDGRFELRMSLPGLLRPLRQAELSDGMLRYLLLVTALSTPRPPPLMILNEPESSLHPSLLPPLARLMCELAEHRQIWVVTHSPALLSALQDAAPANMLPLTKVLGETRLAPEHGSRLPNWRWPAR
ncbi:MAG: AAA family ATPase [Burkholderiaceae bacterium]